MEKETKERWRKLCERAAAEQDPQKLMELVEEINRILEEEQKRRERQRSSGASGS